MAGTEIATGELVTPKGQKSLSNDLLSRRQQILEQISSLHSEKETIEKTLGFDDILWRGHYDGTNCEEWECKKCGMKWISPAKWPCQKCRPDLLER